MQRRVDIPSGEHDHRAFFLDDLPREKSGKGNGSARFNHKAVPVPGEAHCFFDLLVADRYSFRLPATEDCKSDGRHLRRLQRVANGRRGVWLDRHDASDCQRAAHVIPAPRFGKHDLGIGKSKRNTGCKPTPSTWNDDARGRAVHLIGNFESGGSLTRDDGRIVETRHDGRTALFGKPSSNPLATLGATVIKNNLGALRSSALNFHLGSIGGHDDYRSNAKPPGGDCHAARVVARRESDHSLFALLGEELKKSIGCATQFEGATCLEAFAFQPDPFASNFAFDQRSSCNETRNAACSRDDIVASDNVNVVQVFDLAALSTDRCSLTTKISSIETESPKNLYSGTPQPYIAPPLPHGTSNRKAALCRTYLLEVP